MTDHPHETLDEALYAIQEEIGVLPKDGNNPHFGSSFTQLPTLYKLARPVAKAHGVVVRHQINGSVLRHELWFNNALYEVYDVELPNPQGTAQGFGSAVTYMRRYDTVCSLGLVSEDMDDDGNAASAKPSPKQTERRPSPVVPPAGRGAAARTLSTEEDDFDATF